MYQQILSLKPSYIMEQYVRAADVDTEWIMHVRYREKHLHYIQHIAFCTTAISTYIYEMQ